MTACIACARGLPAECELDPCNCTVCDPPESIVPTIEVKGDRSREFKDALSTGRKRAAMLYPYICNVCGHTKEQHPCSNTKDSNEDVCSCSVFEFRACEWQGFKHNGGGKYPTIGCSSGRGTDRHHGPIADTLRNELGNVHRICSQCHQRWHQLNHYFYDEQEAMKQTHSPEPATASEIALNDLRWANGYMKANFKLKTGKVDSND